MQICVSLTETTTAGLVDRMIDLAPVADLFEIRADLVEDLDQITVLRARTRPLVFTCLPRSEGGRWPDNDPNRRLKLLEAVKRGFDYVDVNLRSNLVDVMVEKAGRGLIVSYHGLDGLPDDLPALMSAMRERGADIAKIAVMPKTVADVGRLMAFARSVAESGGPPLSPIARGPLGVPPRLLGGRSGAPFTFASTADGAEAAPGQVPLDRMAGLYRVRQVGPGTRVFGLLGRGISYTLSPVIHNAAFAALGIDAIYVPLDADSLDAFLAALPGLQVSGFSVTQPYKVELVRHLAAIDEVGRECGAVNTVVVDGAALRGWNTDGVGVVAPIVQRLEPRGKRIVILGAGGAARSAALSLVRRGAAVTVLARRAEKAAAIAAGLGCASGDLAEIARYDWDVLINATPVGSVSQRDATPVRADLLRSDGLVMDMVYAPRETRLLREARERGCTVIDGLEMLLAQAAAQFEIWTGRGAPVAAMRAALIEAAGERP
jgi:3-dehydroquinate dehydratase/shikimate dehydrogenase